MSSVGPDARAGANLFSRGDPPDRVILLLVG
jgi:hypothetical protein